MGYLVITNGNVAYNYQFRMSHSEVRECQGIPCLVRDGASGGAPFTALGRQEGMGRKKEPEYKKAGSSVNRERNMYALISSLHKDLSMV
jgi:hypothetical protein